MTLSRWGGVCVRATCASASLSFCLVPPTDTIAKPRRLFFWLTEFAVLLGLWFLFVSTFKRNELLVGVVAAALGATGAMVVEAQRFAQFRPRLKWLLFFLVEPWY